jgi:peptide/nickel transport system permease protein
MVRTSRLQKFTSSTGYRITKYILVRVVTIFITIVLGVFIAVVIANTTGQIDLNVHKRIEQQTLSESYAFGRVSSEEQRQAFQLLFQEMAQEVGLNLPFLQRHLRWTYNALTFNWGDMLFLRLSTVSTPFAMPQRLDHVKDIVMQRFPNTLLLVGTAYLLIFIIGIPLALSLSRKHGSWQDRLLSFLAPLSSVPSWVLGILLLFIFALELRLLPFGGMLDLFPPETRLGYFPIVLKHMTLPVAAIVISLLFQLIYTWRTFFLIYAREDYVELAQAMGLPFKSIDRKYILRPSFPYVVTSFALTLVSFWQTTTALEIVFNWPGIGQLYIESLPHFWGESMFPGEMVIILALVVLFAYLLGFTVLTLDVIYAIVDPRIRMGKQDTTLRIVRRVSWLGTLIGRWKNRRSPIRTRLLRYDLYPDVMEDEKAGFSLRGETIKARIEALKSVFRELVRYPSAVFGLIIIAILIGGSIYAVVALPYIEVGELWNTEVLSGSYYVPKLAQPEWLNLFRKDDLLSTIVLNSRDGTASKIVEPGSNETSSVMITFTFDYSYGAVPEELLVYFTPQYNAKRPFVFMTWVTPDGREIELKALSIAAEKRVNITDHIPHTLSSSQKLVDSNHFSEQTGRGDPELYVLFADPAAETQIPLKGIYTLRIDGLVFEDGADLDAELVILGQVYGLAGTDYMRRDLIVPLLWGMPFALAIGLLGALLTTVASMIVAAAGVWYGGWLDALIQRITEANMILPILAICVLFYAIFNVSLWTILGFIVLLNVFGSPTKAFRSAFLQVKEAPYIEAAQAYGVSSWRIILRYMTPRVIPVIIPHLVALIPAFVFLEATLGMFNIKSIYPTWGKVIYQALKYGSSWGSRYYVLGPIVLLLLTGFAFAMIGFALDRILNPRLREM